MKFSNPYFTTRLKIEMLQRWILTHSHIYYELNTSIVPDEMFDRNSRQLVEMMEENKEDASYSRYGYAFEDFDGSTGFGLTDKLNSKHQEIIFRDAAILIDQYGRK